MMTTPEFLIAFTAIFLIFGSAWFAVWAIYKLIKTKMDRNNTSVSDKEIQELIAFKARTEKRLQALEHIITSDEEYDKLLSRLEEDDIPQSSVIDSSRRTKLKNQLKS